MKISREARRLARELFGMSFVDGRLDTTRVSAVADEVLAKKPRHYHQVLKEYTRLVRLEMDKRRARVESAVELPAEQAAAIESGLRQRFGDDISITFHHNPALIGGLRVQVGSDVWDGSIKSRLEVLRTTI